MAHSLLQQLRVTYTPSNVLNPALQIRIKHFLALDRCIQG